MLTPQTAIWISPENVLSLHCTGATLQQTRGCSGAFWWFTVIRQAQKALRRQHLEKITKHLGKTTKERVLSICRINLRRLHADGTILSQNHFQKL